MKNFDRFVGIDWSGAKLPLLTPSIAVSIADKGTEPPVLIDRRWSRHDVGAWIEEQTRSKKRLLIGIDCNFGYAYEVIKRQFGKRASYWDLWQAVETICYNQPNYYADQFWQHETYQNDFWVVGKKREGFVMPQRLTEKACVRSGLGHPESPFKLIGAKQVGKGGLAGMRLACNLKKKCGDRIAFWPFEMDLVDQAKIVVTEIYPRQFLIRAGFGHKKIRHDSDLNQSLKALRSEPMPSQAGQPLSDHVTDAILSAAGLRYLCGTGKKVPKDVSHPSGMTYNAQNAEGWIFGVTG